MNLPTKISPDRLRDSIIEIAFQPNMPEAVIGGVLYQSMSDRYTFINVSEMYREYLFIDDNTGVSFSLDEFNVITFNFFTDFYPGWAKYFSAVEMILGDIEKTGAFLTCNHLGLRYISDYEGIGLGDITKFNFTFGMPQTTSNSFQFSSEFKFDKFRVNLSLSHNFTESEDPSEKRSIIDIDVQKKVSINKMSVLIEEIERAHKIQKRIFFSTLNENFLKTLNPEY